MKLRIAHLSDVHLEAKFVYLGDKANEHRKTLQRTFATTIEKISNSDYSLVLIAGDLFDNPFPSQSTVYFVVEQLEILLQKKKYVLLLAGNHDRNQPGSVYDNSPITKIQSPYFHLVNKQSDDKWIIDELRTVVHSFGIEKQKSSQTPYRELRRDNKYLFNIGVFHGSADIRGVRPTNYPILLNDIYDARFDYTALGDWHNVLDLSRDINTPVWYSGSLELVDSDQQKSGYFLDVQLDKANNSIVTPIIVGSKRAINLKVDVGQIKTFEALMAYVKKYFDKNTVMSINLVGNIDFNNELEINEIKKGLVDKFYHLNLIDQRKLLLTDQNIGNYSDKMLIGRFIKIMLTKKKDNDAEYNQTVDEAIRIGVSLLKGERL